MQIKRHCLLIEVMHSEDFFSGVNTPSSSSKQAALTAKVPGPCISFAMPALCRFRPGNSRFSGWRLSLIFSCPGNRAFFRMTPIRNALLSGNSCLFPDGVPHLVPPVRVFLPFSGWPCDLDASGQSGWHVAIRTSMQSFRSP